MDSLLAPHSSHLLYVFHQRFQERDGAVHAGELEVVVFGDLDAVALAQFHDDVEEVHAVEFELIAEVHGIVEISEIFVGGDDFEDVEDFFFDVFCGHWSGVPLQSRKRRG